MAVKVVRRAGLPKDDEAALKEEVRKTHIDTKHRQTNRQTGRH